MHVFSSFIIFVTKSERKTYMKRLLYILLLVIWGIQTSFAQNEKGNYVESTRVKEVDGFILDMGSMLNIESLPHPVQLPTLNHVISFDDPDFYKVSLDAFKLDKHFTYMRVTNMTQLYTPFYFSLSNNISINSVNWQGCSYKLNNGIRINMYGEYNADGYKTYNPSAVFPWKRKSFNAAFEMKSANGNFGVRVEVNGGRNNLY